MPETVRLVDPDGVERDVSADAAPSLLQDPRWRLATTGDTLSRLSTQAREADYGGVGGAVKAGLAGVSRGATLGLTDVVGRAIYGDQAALDLEGLRDVNPGVSTGSEIAGALLPAAVTGGASLPSSLAGVAGRGAARALGGGLRGALAGGAVEGAIFGAGQGASELALSTEPLTVERAASVLSSNTLFGAAVGGAAGGLGKAAELGLRRAGQSLDGYLAGRAEARAAEAAKADVAAGPITAESDVSLLDRKGLDTAEQAELARIDAERAPMREKFVNDLEAAHKARETNKEWLSIVADRHPDKYVRENAKVVFNADRRIRNLLDNRAGLAERPARAREWLQQEQQALESLIAAGRNDLEKFAAAAADAPRAVREQLLAGDIPGYKVGPGAIKDPAVIDNIVAREVAARFPRGENGGLIVPREMVGFEDNRLGIALGKNHDLLQFAANIERTPRSDRLTAISDAREALRSGAATPEPAPSLGHEVLSAVAPFAGPLGAIAAHGTKAISGLRKVAGAVAEKSGQAASRFLGAATKATKAAQPYAPAAATKILAQVRFSDERSKREEEPKTLPELYRRRADELKSQVHVDLDGTVQMRPDARQKLAAKFDGIRAVDPLAADQLETIGARRITWLASQLPKRPDFAVLQVGPDRHRSPDFEMRAWAQKVAAVEDPSAVFQRAASGRTVTPEQAMAIRAVYPEMLGAFNDTIVNQLPTLQKTLPFEKRLSLSVLTGKPVDPAMAPGVLRVIQSMYATEPGTAGGTQPPIPQPQFGSVKRSDPGTPAQRRQGMTT